VKILDFGIAKALGGDKDESTKTGTLKGKFAYMAPEQTVSNEIDRRIDIFATGHRPARGPDRPPAVQGRE